MGLNERFLENEQNISALKIHRTGISVLLLICMWISLLDCGTVRIMDVKMAAYEMKAMPSAVEAEKGILTAGRCYPAWEKMKDSMVTDKKILPAVSQTLETAEAGIEKNVTVNQTVDKNCNYRYRRCRNHKESCYRKDKYRSLSPGRDCSTCDR